jgi:hypothetical protein
VTARGTSKTWVINSASIDSDEVGQKQLVVGLTTEEWVRISGDQERPGDATTFVWIVLSTIGGLMQIGFRPHDHVTEQECLDQVRVLLAMVRPFDVDGEDPKRLLGRKLPKRGP